MDLGIILGIAGIVAAFVVPIGIERIERPRIEIVASSWSPTGPVDRTFATVRVRNKPLRWLFRKLMTRQAAQACRVDLDYYRWGTDERALATISGRWSSNPQPIRYNPHSSDEVPLVVGPPVSGAPAGWTAPQPETNAQYDAFYDSSLDSRQRDVAVSPEGEEVPVAVLTGSEAFAFSTESYDYSDYGRPDWRLNHGTYRVAIRVRGSSIDCQESFKLEYASADFSSFKLERV